MTEQTRSGEKSQSDEPRRNFWETAEKISKTFSIAAIPVVLAIGGWMIQRRLQDQTLQRDYVQLAVTVLKEPASSQDMKDWAVSLLAKNSPVPFAQSIQVNLSNGNIQLPAKFEVAPAAAAAPPVETTASGGDSAGDWELKGFDALFSRDADSALEAFKNAEKKSSTYHSVKEIRELLESKKAELNAAPKEGPSPAWNAVYSTVLKKYSWRLLPEIKSTLADRISKS
jgi:hypothetical protein